MPPLRSCLLLFVCLQAAAAAESGQPLASNASRVLQALDVLGQPPPDLPRGQFEAAIQAEDGPAIQRLLDPAVLAIVSINPESRVRAERGAATVVLQQAGFTAAIVKVHNQGSVKMPLEVRSPQAGPSYSGSTRLSVERLDQPTLHQVAPPPPGPRRFAVLDWHTRPPMTASLTGAPVEYAILLIGTDEPERQEIVLQFSVGAGTQDLGFRGEVPIVFESRPAVPLRIEVADAEDVEAFVRLVFRDAHDRVWPSQIRRLAPDLFFQEQVYRKHGEIVWLAPGRYTVESSRGPEHLHREETLDVRSPGGAGAAVQTLTVAPQRWVSPRRFGWWSGDHHIHGAGCAHYQDPTQGVTPADMFRQISGEGLNVGCVLTWGPCFEHQRRFFRPQVDLMSRPDTLMKYDLEISGFGSQALGHVCLLNLSNQEYPGSDGTKERGWPTWTTPVLRWAKDQGAVTGYAHSASGLQIEPASASRRLLARCDADGSGLVSRVEGAAALLPADFDRIDTDGDGGLSAGELHAAVDRVADELPNLAIPDMNGVGAMELPVAVAEGVCDFISAMDTPRIAEWNMWYHVLNCGFPLKAAGETDFPCMSGMAVGQGRTYVRLGSGPLEFSRWCAGLAAGRSYVSDGYAHALEFVVSAAGHEAEAGGRLELPEGGVVRVRARVAFAPQLPESIAHGSRGPGDRPRWLGDTVTLHGSRSRRQVPGGEQRVELVVNGRAAGMRMVRADGDPHDVAFEVPVEASSWLAVRCFPQLHTNPADVLVAGRPVRASAASARWCAETIRQLWDVRGRNIADAERPAARTAFDRAIERYGRIAGEAAGP